ncbi:hypothetical protein HU200_042250 [Digitaria exilis]|uniref:Glycosyltransferase n=1 Tax=Digitaria exilis TaxID=1010633 RepID=A0A835B4Z8_9POAL|nr:hypothetical protein HU200_042250 [Digitaria exilis]
MHAAKAKKPWLPLPPPLTAKTSIAASCPTSPSSLSWPKATPSLSWISPPSSRRGLAAVTLFTTPGRNAAFARGALAKAGAGDDDTAVVVELPFPDDGGHGAAAAAGSAEDVASASCFSAFIEATSLLRPWFEDALAASLLGRRARRPKAVVHGRVRVHAALGVPRLSFMGASAFTQVVRELAMRDKPGATPTPHQDGHPGSDDDASTDTYTVPVFPHLRFKLSEFAPMSASDIELHAKASAAVAASQGVIVNTFQDLESRYIDHWNRCIGPRAWPIGPLCLARYSHSVDDRVHAKPSWIRWLDEEAEVGRAVLYIALGTLAAIPEAQLKEVADGLDRAGVDFLWAVRPSNADLGTGFEDRVEGRGKGVREWVDQWEILQHTSIRGFLSHGGWNSVLESITAGVPMAVWPIEFEQPMNARFLVDELKVGIRIYTDGGRFSLVKSEEVTRVVRELMFGEEGAIVSASVKAMGVRARLPMLQGGSSWKIVEEMIGELCTAT